MLPGLRALLDHLGRHPNSAGGDLTQARRDHVLHRQRPLVALLRRRGAPPPRRQARLDVLVRDEEERGAGRGADYGGAHAGVDASEAAGGAEGRRGLEARLQRVEGVEGEVDGRAGQGAGEERGGGGGDGRGGHVGG